MPSKDVYDEFLRRGIRVDRDPYCRYDRLECRDDFARLFEVLDSVKDQYSHPAVLTTNTVSANPLFSDIEASGFTQYFFEPFTETYRHDPSFDGTWEMWQQGMDAHLIRPQFHGREHLNVRKWLRVLQEGETVTKQAFHLGTFGLTQLVDPSIKEYYMGAFNSGLDEDIAYYEQLLTEGLDMFQQTFGFRSESFIATTYEWSPKIEPCLVQQGVKYIQGTVCQKIPLDNDNTVKYVISHRLRWRVRDMLDQLNVSERIMYPGLDGLSKWIARHYFVKNN